MGYTLIWDLQPTLERLGYELLGKRRMAGLQDRQSSVWEMECRLREGNQDILRVRHVGHWAVVSVGVVARRGAKGIKSRARLAKALGEAGLHVAVPDADALEQHYRRLAEAPVVIMPWEDYMCFIDANMMRSRAEKSQANQKVAKVFGDIVSGKADMGSVLELHRYSFQAEGADGDFGPVEYVGYVLGTENSDEGLVATLLLTADSADWPVVQRMGDMQLEDWSRARPGPDALWILVKLTGIPATTTTA